MRKIRVLDCTLRDGGYCNQWQFGKENIKKIISRLTDAGVDIIECGFLTNKVQFQPNVSKFNTIDQVSAVIPKNRNGKLFVCMMNYGEYSMEDLPPYDGTSIDGIRLAFHKKNLIEALEISKQIQEKGYKLFIQAMVSLNYTDEEFLHLIFACNELKAYSFYIVDSFGVMKQKELIRLFYMVEHNLDKNIPIGYHSHNNLQLAYSNAQTLVDIQTNQDLIIDTSIFGMGRGAGNLNTELFVEYLNDNAGGYYDIKPLLNIIDEVLNRFYQTNYWGYSLPNYLSAKHNAHPDYASYLEERHTLTVENMDEIFSIMDENKKNGYDVAYIEDLYVRYLATGKTYNDHLNELREKLQGKQVLIIAPGRSVEDEKDKIIAYAGRENVISISVNFDYKYRSADYIFLSNLRRFKKLNPDKRYKTIVTSNIPVDGAYLQTQYRCLLNDIDAVKDNASMMLIQFLINLDVKDIVISGIDGYSHDIGTNFAEGHLEFVTKNTMFDAMNAGMIKILSRYSKEINISYLTEQKYVKL